MAATMFWRRTRIHSHRILGSRRNSNAVLGSLSVKPTGQEKLTIDAAILQHAATQPRPIHLHDLVKWKQFNGKSPPTEDLLLNARYVIEELTTRLARRLDAMRSLPLIVVLNPHVSEIYNIYYNSFRVMSSMEPPRNTSENEKLVEILRSLVHFHSDTIPTLAKGFSQCKDLLGVETINDILLNHLKARIGTRILAEHHIGLTNPIGDNFVGCIQTDLNPASVCEQTAKTVAELVGVQFGAYPALKIDLGRDVQLAYPPNHLEYILMELLKNSFRAVCLHGDSFAEQNPITVTVIKSGLGVIIRIRDRGGGIVPGTEEELFQFAQTTVERDSEGLVEGEDVSLAGLGYGLPLSKAYAEFFGGKLQLQSYHGWGTDVYLTLKSPMTSGYHRDIL